MKANVFTGKQISFEFENVVAVLKADNHNLEIWLYGGFKYLIEDAIEISDFKIWYGLYLEEKFGEPEEIELVEEDLGL